jgi:peptidoglycan/xylan/chitin deacetylase (PgdA/CDA1 family)
MPELRPSRRRLKLVLCRALDFLHIHPILLSRIRRNGAVVILNLHRISPEENPFWSPLHPRYFDELLGFIKRRFEVVLFRDLTRREIPAIGPSSRPRLVLSFDDGYGDFLEYALPILEKHGLPANQNVIGDCVRSGQPPWNVLMYDFLRSAPCSLINEAIPPGFDRRLDSDNYESKLRFGLALSRHLKRRPQAERRPMWDHIESVMRKADYTQTRMMRVADLKGMPGSCEVGCHSFSHESMGYESDEFFEDDFAMCRSLFAGTLGLPLAIYAFPNGSFRPPQVDFLLRSGIKHVLLMEERLSGFGPVYTRLTMSAESVAEARLLALGLRAKGIYHS